MIPKAKKFIREFRSGSSLPFLVEADEGTRYVIKLHGSGEGKDAMITGFISSRIAALLDVTVLQESLIWFDPGIIPSKADPEIIELAERSAGINTATVFLAEAQPYSLSMNAISQKEQENIFLTDMLLMNIDRTVKNPNILCSGSFAYSYDYSMSMAVRKLFEEKSSAKQNLLPLLKRHLFHADAIDSADFISRAKQITELQLSLIIAELPEEWISGYDINELSDKLMLLTSATDELLKNLELLRQLPSESEEEIRKKNLRSRQAFLDKFGKI